jgi:serine/threonine protein kinase
MKDIFKKLDQLLNKKGITLAAYQDYLFYENASSFASISDILKSKNIDLQGYQHYLNQSTQLQQTLPSNSLKQEQSVLEGILLQLLENKKIEKEVLNLLLSQVPLKTPSPFKESWQKQWLLQQLLKQHLLSVEEFLFYDTLQIASQSQSQTSSPFFLSFQGGKYTIFSRNQDILATQIKESRRLGNYHLLEEIGRGGMGVVYKAYHAQLKQCFALKVLLEGNSRSGDFLKRFHREIQTMAKLDHPGIVRIIDSGEVEGKPYLAMEFIEGQNLKEILAQRFSVRKTLILFQKILQALHYAHSQWILHRDLKPDNIFITSQGEPKLGDFGLAKDLEEDSRKSQKLTQSGAVLGTARYMSPEQIQGDVSSLDARSDIYSVAVCLYHFLSKKHPFAEAKSIHALFHAVLSKDPPPPSLWRKDIHRDLDTLILKALQRDREKRYRTALDFSEDIERFLQGIPIEARPASPWERLQKEIQRNLLTILAISTLFFLLLVFPLLAAVETGSSRVFDFLRFSRSSPSTRKRSGLVLFV